MTRRLSTGIDVLDHKLDGGIPEGNIVALSADPASQSALVLSELARPLPTVYLTGRLPEATIRQTLDRGGGRPERASIHRLGTDDPFSRAMRVIRALDDRATVIVDPMDVLERATDTRQQRFLNELRDRLVETGGMAVLHCLDGRTPPANRDLTLYMADIVFELETSVPRETVENRLAIPKFRGGSPPEEAIKLDLREAVTVDISRDIA